ncbi:MAG: hypothetical protein LBU87_00380, partial [Lactobacillales bacterium]|nr:hypothetical protein [Lactobacillales bacterium]
MWLTKFSVQKCTKEQRKAFQTSESEEGAKKKSLLNHPDLEPLLRLFGYKKTNATTLSHDFRKRQRHSFWNLGTYGHSIPVDQKGPVDGLSQEKIIFAIFEATLAKKSEQGQRQMLAKTAPDVLKWIENSRIESLTRLRTALFHWLCAPNDQFFWISETTKDMWSYHLYNENDKNGVPICDLPPAEQKEKKVAHYRKETYLRLNKCPHLKLLSYEIGLDNPFFAYKSVFGYFSKSAEYPSQKEIITAFDHLFQKKGNAGLFDQVLFLRQNHRAVFEYCRTGMHLGMLDHYHMALQLWDKCQNDVTEKHGMTFNELRGLLKDAQTPSEKRALINRYKGQ